MLHWHKIAESLNEISFAENNIAEVSADGKTICVAKFNDQIFACAHKCPHASGLFIEGYIDVISNIYILFHHFYIH